MSHPTTLELRLGRALASDSNRARHYTDTETALDELHRRQSLGLAPVLWECPCGGSWVVPSPLPRNVGRGPCGALPPWEGDDR